MSRSMSFVRAPVASLDAKRAEQESDAAFLDMLHSDITDNPGRIEPIPASLFGRMERLRAKAEANRARTELLEG